ncbi:MAG: C1 family peptidase [Candidatus Zixiibacteriota bacterium]
MRHLSITATTALVLFAFCITTPQIFAGEGGLSATTIEQIKSSHHMDAHAKAMYNAITNNDINGLALNRDLLRQNNEVFSHKIKAKGITNQKSSGRCWLFAGLNIMRPAVIEKYKLGSFEFSQPYLQFWDKMEKANCFLEYIIEYRDRDPLDREMEILLRGPIGDGGWWKYVVDLIGKYGVVPKEVMPETASSENTGMMNKLIARKLRMDAVQLRNMSEQGSSVADLRSKKAEMLAGVYDMLALNLGEPPSDFPWRFEDRDSVVSESRMYTPQKFYKEFVGVDLNEYVNIFNDPTKDYGKHYLISMSRNMYDAADINFANVEIKILKDAALQSVLADEPVWFACDVGKDQDREHGIMAMDIYEYEPIYGTGFSMTKSDRALYRESAPNHAMVFVGVDVKDDQPVKWLVENSWGTEKGSGGYWTLYDSWFDNHVYNVIVKKEYAPKDVLKIYEQDPIVLPPWDPMYSLIKE